MINLTSQTRKWWRYTFLLFSRNSGTSKEQEKYQKFGRTCLC